MHTPRSPLFLLSFLIFFLAAHARNVNHTHCISSTTEADTIARRWLNAFASGGIDTLSSAVTPDIRIYDEGFTNGSSRPETTNIHSLHDIIASGPYGGNGVTNVTYDVIFTLHNCDHISLRWQQNVITTSMIGYGSTLPAGKKVSFRGTDLLRVELRSRKVSYVTTSSDLLNYYRGLGYDLGVWSATG